MLIKKSKKKKKKGNGERDFLGGSGRSERGLTWLDDIAQQQGRGPPGERVPKGSGILGNFLASGCHLALGDSGCDFLGCMW